MGLKEITRAAFFRRERRWEKEKAKNIEAAAHHSLVAEIARWKKVDPSDIKLSNVACRKAPADLGCVYVASAHPLSNQCVFGCGGTEEDFF